MDANGREYPVALDEHAWAILQRIYRVRFREFRIVNRFMAFGYKHNEK
jgi:hypothetical protein